VVRAKLKFAYAISLGEGTLIDYGYAARPPEPKEIDPDKPEAYEVIMVMSPCKKFKETGQ
jgi:hypothetical protein